MTKDIREMIIPALNAAGVETTTISCSMAAGEMPELTIKAVFNPWRCESDKPQKKETVKLKNPNDVKRILKNGDYMTVLWDDGTKTIVKRAEDEPESDYAAFTAALGIRCYGSNSALKKLVASAEWQHKKKQKKEEK